MTTQTTEEEMPKWDRFPLGARVWYIADDTPDCFMVRKGRLLMYRYADKVYPGQLGPIPQYFVQGPTTIGPAPGTHLVISQEMCHFLHWVHDTPGQPERFNMQFVEDPPEVLAK